MDKLFPHDLIHEGGALCVWLAAGFSAVQGVMGWGLGPGNRFTWQCCTRGVAFFQALFAFLAWMILAYSHVTLDFSFVTVLTHVSRHLSPLYRLGATWTSPEGSMLLWCTMLSLWSALFAGLCSPSSSTAKTLSLIGLVNFSFWGLLLGWFDPFVTLAHQAADGLGLNPLLHDVSLMIHPLFLYGGYTSLLIPFCLSLCQTSDMASAVQQTLWLLIPWSLLTAGLLTGSIWAYYELGWGGWWFWDPVENIALLPWLLVTAALHVQKKSALRPLIPFLTILAFLFVFLGTTCVRAGLFTSVHSFASLPSRTLPLLICVLLWVLPSLAYALYRLKRDTPFSSLLTFGPKGRHIPVFFFIIVTSVVACGTFLPLTFQKLLHLNETFYNQTLFILMIGPFILIPFTSLKESVRILWTPFILTLLLLWILTVFLTIPSFKAILCLGLALWIGLGSLPLFRTAPKWPHALAHLGVAFCLGGISVGSFWKAEIEQPLTVGDSCPLGPYTLTFQGAQLQRTPLFDAEKARLSLKISPFSDPIVLKPERRLYHPQDLLTTETAIHTRPHRDIYVVLGDFVGDNTWIIRATLYPGLWGIWGGGFLMISSGILALWRRRKRFLSG